MFLCYFVPISLKIEKIPYLFGNLQDVLNVQCTLKKIFIYETKRYENSAAAKCCSNKCFLSKISLEHHMPRQCKSFGYYQYHWFHINDCEVIFLKSHMMLLKLSFSWCYGMIKIYWWDLSVFEEKLACKKNVFLSYCGLVYYVLAFILIECVCFLKE